MKQQETLTGICLCDNAYAFVHNTALFQLQKKLLQSFIENPLTSVGFQNNSSINSE